MWFVALFGLVALATAGLALRRPTRRRLEFVQRMSQATLYSALAGIVSDLATVAIHITGRAEWAESPKVHLLILEGIGESMAPGILGFTLLSLTSFLAALAVRRLPEHGE
jgi:hypothetical protein